MSTIYSDPAQLSRHLPERVAYIRLYADNGKGEYDSINEFDFRGLNVRFSVKMEFSARDAKLTGGNSGEFGVCNLSAEARKALANRFREVEYTHGRYARAEVYAGYMIPQSEKDKDGNPLPKINKVSKIFDGSILSTSVTAPPDIWFNFSGITNFNRHIQPVEKTLTDYYGNLYETLTFENIVRAVAEYCGMGYSFITPDGDPDSWYKYGWSGDLTVNAFNKNILDKKFKTYTITGTQAEALRQLALSAPKGVGVFVDQRRNSIVIAETDQQGMMKVAPSQFHEWYISEETGLIGVPQFGVPVVTVQTLFNPDIYPGDTVHLKTKSMPYWDGKYRVGRLQHNGELRGNNFYTMLELWNT